MVTYSKPGEWGVESLSPNQLAKRAEIVKATAKLMTRDGIRSCTARSVAKAGNVSTSALHYYFRDIDEIIDLAFRLLMDALLERIEHEVEEASDPVEALWAASCTYLGAAEYSSGSVSPRSRPRRAPLLWFEFHLKSMRVADIRTVQELSAKGARIFTDVVSAVGVNNADKKSEVLYCALLGATVRDTLFHRDAAIYAVNILRSLDLPIPERAMRKSNQSKRQRE